MCIRDRFSISAELSASYTSTSAIPTSSRPRTVIRPQKMELKIQLSHDWKRQVQIVVELHFWNSLMKNQFYNCICENDDSALRAGNCALDSYKIVFCFDLYEFKILNLSLIHI